MKYRIKHVTTYHYSDAVALCHNCALLTPRAFGRQLPFQEDLWIQPEPGVLDRHVDYFGNVVHFFTIQEMHKELSITANHRVQVLPAMYPQPEETPAWEDVVAHLKTTHHPEVLDAYQYTFDSHYVRRHSTWLDYARPSFPAKRPMWAGVLDLASRIHREFKYDPRATTVATPLHEMFARKRGVCQDFAHLQIACLRSLGLAARYVSGYLETKPPEGQPRLIGADASHAWLQAFCPDFGWLDIDPTNNVAPSDRHVLLAWGRDYDDVSPLKGIILGGGSHTVSVSVDVMPLDE